MDLTRRSFGAKVLSSMAAIPLTRTAGGVIAEPLFVDGPLRNVPTTGLCEIYERRVYAVAVDWTCWTFEPVSVAGNEVWFAFESLEARSRAWDLLNSSASWQQFARETGVEVREIGLYRPVISSGGP